MFKHLWADTLGKRLFVLMWVALVGSHLVAFYVAHPLTHNRPPSADAAPGVHPPGLPPLPSLPPSDLGDPGHGPGSGPVPDRDGPPPGPPPDAGGPSLWLDYTTRALVIALFAAFGARWLARPMRRLSAASRALGDSLARGAAPTPIDEQQGTVEVRQTAVVFNDMASRLHHQFDARGLVMASLSHDLRTPMTRLRMRLELTRGETADPTVTDRCIADLREMDTLIDSLLDALRDERSPEPRQPLDVHALVQALADDLAEQGHLVVVTGETQVASAAPMALRRVLSNLLGNALRYAGQAQADVRADGSHIVVVIDDNGPGIPADQVDAVFEPFVRIETSRNRASGGTGLGLHIARELTQRHGGQLTLANRAEGGLRASLRLPRD
jgi:signal transduction histidine kinase